MKIYLGKAGRAVALTAAFMMVALGAGCSSMDSESVADHHIGPVGPTYPSYFYYDVTVTPHSVLPPATVTFVVRVWDHNGNLVSGATMTAAGPDTSTEGVTDDAGLAYLVLKISKSTASSGAGVVFVTINIEDAALTVPIQLIPSMI